MKYLFLTIIFIPVFVYRIIHISIFNLFNFTLCYPLVPFYWKSNRKGVTHKNLGVFRTLFYAPYSKDYDLRAEAYLKRGRQKIIYDKKVLCLWA